MTTGKTVGCELCQQLHSTRCSWFQHLHQYDRLAQLARAVVSRVRVTDRSTRGNAPGLPYRRIFSLTMQEEKMKVNVKGYLICPHCGRKTKTKVIVGITKMTDFPLWCPWCKKESKVNYP